jgi:hypothetical protein
MFPALIKIILSSHRIEVHTKRHFGGRICPFPSSRHSRKLDVNLNGPMVRVQIQVIPNASVDFKMFRAPNIVKHILSLGVLVADGPPFINVDTVTTPSTSPRHVPF